MKVVLNLIALCLASCCFAGRIQGSCKQQSCTSPERDADLPTAENAQDAGSTPMQDFSLSGANVPTTQSAQSEYIQYHPAYRHFIDNFMLFKLQAFDFWLDYDDFTSEVAAFCHDPFEANSEAAMYCGKMVRRIKLATLAELFTSKKINYISELPLKMASFLKGEIVIDLTDLLRKVITQGDEYDSFAQKLFLELEECLKNKQNRYITKIKLQVPLSPRKSNIFEDNLKKPAELILDRLISLLEKYKMDFSLLLWKEVKVTAEVVDVNPVLYKVEILDHSSGSEFYAPQELKSLISSGVPQEVQVYLILAKQSPSELPPCEQIRIGSKLQFLFESATYIAWLSNIAWVSGADIQLFEKFNQSYGKKLICATLNWQQLIYDRSLMIKQNQLLAKYLSLSSEITTLKYVQVSQSSLKLPFELLTDALRQGLQLVPQELKNSYPFLVSNSSQLTSLGHAIANLKQPLYRVSIQLDKEIHFKHLKSFLEQVKFANLWHIVVLLKQDSQVLTQQQTIDVGQIYEQMIHVFSIKFQNVISGVIYTKYGNKNNWEFVKNFIDMDLSQYAHQQQLE